MRKSLFVAVLVVVLVPFPLRSGPYDEYKSLTPAERWLVLRYFWQAPSVRAAANFARDEAGFTYPQLGGDDDQRDAFRHALWNAGMVRRLGSTKSAERWGNAHEEFAGNPAARKAMDLSNNARGRDISWSARHVSGPWWWRRTTFPGDADLALRVEDAVDRGDLVMIEETAGRRDPDTGRLVPTTRP